MWLLSSRGKSFEAVFTFLLWMLRYRSRRKKFQPGVYFLPQKRAVSPKEIARTARERGGGTLCVVEVLLTEYNKRMKANTLSWIKFNKLRNAHLSEESNDAPAE